MADSLGKNSLSLRNASSADESFLFEVYASTRAEEMAMVPWTDEQRQSFLQSQFTAQHDHYHERYPDAAYQVIMQSDEPVGRIYLVRDEGSLDILDITIHPKHRNAGIGTAVIEQVMSEAAQSEKSVRIYVETFNRSQTLFQKLGFAAIEQDGFNLLLEWRASSSNSDQQS